MLKTIKKTAWIFIIPFFQEKRKFCQIYRHWILIEQTSLYMLVYRTFLYNPTNLKVPKKAPCQEYRECDVSRLYDKKLLNVFCLCYRHALFFLFFIFNKFPAIYAFHMGVEYDKTK